jgi:creatinine deaminase
MGRYLRCLNRDAVLYSLLMTCYFCAGAAVQFGIKKVSIGEARNFAGAWTFIEEHGIEVIDSDPGEYVTLMQRVHCREHKALE